jgi:hypothetical protein
MGVDAEGKFFGWSASPTDDSVRSFVSTDNPDLEIIPPSDPRFIRMLPHLDDDLRIAYVDAIRRLNKQP